jgi:hypothetical protein
MSDSCRVWSQFSEVTLISQTPLGPVGYGEDADERSMTMNKNKYYFPPNDVNGESCSEASEAVNKDCPQSSRLQFYEESDFSSSGSDLSSLFDDEAYGKSIQDGCDDEDEGNEEIDCEWSCISPPLLPCGKLVILEFDLPAISSLSTTSCNERVKCCLSEATSLCSDGL